MLSVNSDMLPPLMKTSCPADVSFFISTTVLLVPVGGCTSGLLVVLTPSDPDPDPDPPTLEPLS